MDEDTDCDDHSEDVECNEGRETVSDDGELLIEEKQKENKKIEILLFK